MARTDFSPCTPDSYWPCSPSRSPRRPPYAARAPRFRANSRASRTSQAQAATVRDELEADNRDVDRYAFCDELALPPLRARTSLRAVIDSILPVVIEEDQVRQTSIAAVHKGKTTENKEKANC